MKWSGPNTLKRKILISKTGQKAVDEIGKTVRAVGHSGLAVEEAHAWFRGAKNLSTFKRKIAMLKSGLKPFSSYVNFPIQHFGKMALYGAGAAAIGYGLFRRNNAKSK